MVANGKKALNMVSFNFLGVAGDTSIKVSPLFSDVYHASAVVLDTFIRERALER